MEVMGLQATYRPGRRNKLCTTITVEQDVECMCGCNVKPSDCGQNQVNIFIRGAGGTFPEEIHLDHSVRVGQFTLDKTL